MRASRRALAALGAGAALPALVCPGDAGAQNVRWTQIPGEAMDVGAGGGTAFVIGTNAKPGGYGIYRWNGPSGGTHWSALPGAGTNIAVDGGGNPWVVNDAGGIYRWNGGGWDRLPGEARDIGIGGNRVFVIGTNAVPGGFGIYRWNGRASGNAWDRVPGGAVRIAVDENGQPWVVNDRGDIFLWSGSGFEQVAGKAQDIGAGGREVYVIGTNATRGGYGIYRWAGVGPRPWENIPGGARRVAVDSQGRPWVVNDAGSIFRG